MSQPQDQASSTLQRDDEMEDIYRKYPSLRKWANVPDSEIEESHDGRELTLLKWIYAHPSLPSLRNNPAALLEAIDEFAAKEDFLINIGIHKASVLRRLLVEEIERMLKTPSPSSSSLLPSSGGGGARSEEDDENGQVITLVELGGYVGYSAILFGDILRSIYVRYAHHDGPQSKGTARIQLKKVRVISIELEPVIASVAMNLIALAGLSDIVSVEIGKADETLRRLKGDGMIPKNGVSVLFLDHVEDLYTADLKVADDELGLLKRPGGLVVADNVLKPGAPEYRAYLREETVRYDTWAVPGLIVPGDFQDELDFSRTK